MSQQDLTIHEQAFRGIIHLTKRIRTRIQEPDCLKDTTLLANVLDLLETAWEPLIDAEELLPRRKIPVLSKQDREEILEFAKARSEAILSGKE